MTPLEESGLYSGHRMPWHEHGLGGPKILSSQDLVFTYTTMDCYAETEQHDADQT